MNCDKKPLYGKSLTGLKDICLQLGLPGFTAKQMADWLYKKGVTSIEQMSNISAKGREALSRDYTIGVTPPIQESVSGDGTKKYLFKTADALYIESAYIPDRERATLCLSTQVGCRMGCKFCATAQQGLTRSLTAGEILNQVASLPERDKLSNLVLMGMGEPLDNIEEVLKALEIVTSPWGYGWSPSRVTLSTAGVTSRIKQLVEGTKVNLAVSLHNPFSSQREAIMPIERAYPIAELIEELKQWDWSAQRRLSFEYILMSGLNDSREHIKELCRLLNGLKCRINIIKFHKIPSSPYFSPAEAKILAFRDALTAKGIHTTIRQSRGEDIKAACGLLSTSYMNEN
ncbi:MAG: 23S rRNA (adenine(2503)-C(2))-methyltransferase RlmN [Rikenellaceae bacterium]